MWISTFARKQVSLTWIPRKLRATCKWGLRVYSSIIQCDIFHRGGECLRACVCMTCAQCNERYRDVSTCAPWVSASLGQPVVLFRYLAIDFHGIVTWLPSRVLLNCTLALVWFEFSIVTMII